ncbi:hypothetical protein NHX12_018940 [Muraenolepis orangiensis]|uniref:Secreted protein n=1 Tax=Muraenolepis orangiensis TaxID=630683 RepID=A0A9Q0D333_9TELE|nr:hypothetical protein NHX12_018940 [Muraenolepis orangiensis]
MSTRVFFLLVILVFWRMMSSDSLSEPSDAMPRGGASEGVCVALAYQETDDKHVLQTDWIPQTLTGNGPNILKTKSARLN